MLLSARMLCNVADVNKFEYAESAQFTEGDGPTIYLQLVDSTVDRAMRPPGRRYLPLPAAVLEVVLHNVDTDKTISRYAIQPFANDGSIWAVVLLPTDLVRGTCSLKLILSEGTKVTRGHVDSAIVAWPINRAR